MLQKLVFVSNGYSSKISGGDAHCNFLLNYFIEKRKNISYIIPKNAFAGLLNNNLDVLRYPNFPFEKNFYKKNFLLLFVYFYRIIISSVWLHKIKPNVVVCSSHLFHDVVPLLFLNNKQKKIVYVHHIIRQQKRQGFSKIITFFLERVSFFILKKRNVKIITVSNAVSDQLVNEYGFAQDDIAVSSNGIDLKMIDLIPKVDSVSFDLVFCARLHLSKGITDLVEIIDHIKKNKSDIRCAVIGDGPNRNLIEQDILAKKLDKNIKLLGFLEEKKKIEIFKSSKVFVLPSHEEGWGIVIAEAMACNLPTVIYKLRDLIEIWKDNVVWIECFNKKKFADEVFNLLSNKDQRDLYSRRSREFSRKLDWQHVLDGEINIINKVIN